MHIYCCCSYVSSPRLQSFVFFLLHALPASPRFSSPPVPSPHFPSRFPSPPLPTQELLLTYNAVGIFEYWELSMQLFDAKVKSPVETWDASVSHNPGVSNDAREELLTWARSSPELHSLLSADVHIYNFSKAVFRSQTQAALGTVWDP